MTEPNQSDADPRLAALLRWRDGLIAAGTVTAASFKEAHIRLVLRSGRTAAEQLRAMLPGPVAEHAEEMARVLREADGPSAAPQAGPGPEATQVVRTLAPTGGATGGAHAVPQSGFAPFQFVRTDHEVAPVSLRRAREGAGVELSWPPFASAPGGYVVYRVISSDEGRGYSPDHGHQISATAATTVRDPRPVTGALRHLQVWVNAGRDRDAALAAQPVLHAAGVLVGTLPDFEIREDSGRVIGKWQVPPGVAAVHIYRVPVELAARSGPAFRILADGPNLTGFVDDDAERGRRYVYQLRCEVDVDGVVRLSDYVQAEVRVSAVLLPVEDLALTTHAERAGGVAFDLSWTAPAFGEVRVYRTAEPPNADAARNELDEGALEHVGLTHAAQLSHPITETVDPAGVRHARMSGVPWPADWHRAYFTPVTVLDGRARLGRPESSVRTGLISDVSLVEYCNKQVLTFDWPQGAASVRIFIAPRGHDPRQGLNGRSYEISLADYEKEGGKHFVNELPHRGCSLHLVPVAYTGGRPVLGAPASVDYGGLLRLWYDVRVLAGPDGMPMTAAVRIRAENDAAGSPPFVLVHNPDRIPLAANDGTAIDMCQLDAAGRPTSGRVKAFQWSSLSAAGSTETWGGDVSGRLGWIRLFADLSPDRLRRLALLDPHVDALRLRPGPVPQ